MVEGFLEAGILYGFVRYFDKKGRLSFVGKHENGQPCGTCWKIIPGGGCVVGEVDSDGHLTGADIAYIYPDFATVLLGEFRDGVMEKAQEACIVGMEENDSGIKVPSYSSPNGHMHVRQIRTFNHICSDPLAPDPYESKFVNVCSSGILGAEEGLFAKVDIAVNTTVAFYNGARVESKDVDVQNWETNNYRIFDPADIPDGAMDIPVWAQSSTAYCATLAHKINHSFLLNTQFVVFDHPKFGLVPCMVAIADIQQGEEILVGYGYQLEASPDWYQLDWKNRKLKVHMGSLEWITVIGWSQESSRSMHLNKTQSESINSC
eukprot:TRINITY_DN8457_c0_g1_i2.p1 TRINITY_DN8457_c0_g1~~TRINITY_DN8457_c0_g1_i2.p1  ORF type:complete len:319 (-),score=77.82 TRINITY_DN8457_c0_g1_i2:34-990(-)